MIKVEGYKAFHGVMNITMANGKELNIEADWLYKPEADCWYGKGSSYPASVCTVVVED